MKALSIIPLIALSVIAIGIAGCKKVKCVSCIAVAEVSGDVLQHSVGCDESTAFIEGYESGFRQSFVEQGDTAIVNCIYEYQ